MKNVLRSTVLVILSIFTAVNPSAKSAPNTMLYQGRLTELTGSPITDSTSVMFSIYKSPENGSPIWSESHYFQPDEFGLFTVELGSLNPLDNSIIDGTKCYLAIGVDSQPEMKPRQLITSVPYAISAGVAMGLDQSATISSSNVAGTAATLSDSQTFSGVNHFENRTDFRGYPVRLGGISAADMGAMLHAEDSTAASSEFRGIYSNIKSSGDGELYSIHALAKRTAGQFVGNTHALYGVAVADGGERYGVAGFARATNYLIANGISYGLYGSASDGDTAIGVFGTAAGSSQNWAGFFDGKVHVTDTMTATGFATMIDHPLQPEKSKLRHMQVESERHLTVYSGKVTLDDQGIAEVTLPDYIEALNSDFIYNLTPIGGPAPNLHVSAQMKDNRFQIAGGYSGLTVSWMLTGVRRTDQTQDDGKVD